jgi:YMGG-like Gly-zipper
MRRVTIPLALAGALLLGGCQSMDSDTGGRAIGGATIGAAGGAVIGALTGSWGAGAAIGALAGGVGGLLYDQYRRDEGSSGGAGATKTGEVSGEKPAATQ